MDPGFACRRPVLAVAFAAALVAATPLGAQSPMPAAPAADPPPLLTTRDAWVAGAFALGTLAAAPLDRPIAVRSQRPDLQTNRALGRTATAFRAASQPGTYLALGAVWAVGRLSGNERMAEAGLRGAEAIGVAFVATGGMKVILGRARPYVDKDRPRDFGFGRGLRSTNWRSFPSGHTTTGFAAAAAITSTVAAHTPGARWPVGAALYTSGALMGLSRIYEDRHWASDVVGGAAVGTLSGLAVSRYHRARPNGRLDRWLLAASIRPADGGGAAVRVAILPGLR